MGNERVSVLVVDDSDVKFNQIRDACHASGLDGPALVQSRTVVDALARMEGFKFDLLILDLHLPFRSGEAARKDCGLEVLKELDRDSDTLVKPGRIVGLTEYDDLLRSQSHDFEKFGSELVCYSESVSEWKTRIVEIIKSLLESNHEEIADLQFDSVFRDRLDWIVAAISRLELPVAAPAAVQFLCSLRAGMGNLVYSPSANPPTFDGDTGNFYFSLATGRICFRQEFKSAWLRVATKRKLTKEEIGDSFDNFIAHELFHVGQFLTTERHSDIRSAQSVLRVVDYHADANAVLSLRFLHSQDQILSQRTARDCFLRLISAALTQISVFDEITNEPRMLPSRFIRHLTWHYQYHRVRLFKGDDPFAQHSLAVEPAFNIRGQTVAAEQKGFQRSWPRDEPADIARDKPHLWMAVPNQYGIPSVLRFLSTKPKNYCALFDGVFDYDFAQSAPFFEELLGT